MFNTEQDIYEINQTLPISTTAKITTTKRYIMFLNPQNIKNIYYLLRYKSHFLIKKITFLIQVDRDLYLLKDILYSLIF